MASGKNPHHEFFKDIFKLIAYNRQNRDKVNKLIFLSEKQGIEKLKQNDLTKAVIESSKDLGVEIELASLE
jgi:aspartate/glutamate racemase